MSLARLPLHIHTFYLTSLAISLAILILSLLDLGFDSLFLGVVGPLVVFAHHGSTALIPRLCDTKTSTPITDISNILSIAVLSIAWLAGSIVVTVWASFYLEGGVEMVAEAFGTPATVAVQGALGLVETLVLISLFVALIRLRKGDRSEELIGEKANPHVTATSPRPHQISTTTPVSCVI